MNLINSKNLSVAYLQEIFKLAFSFRNNYKGSLEGRTIANVFLESSTRTRLSFEIAMKKCKGDVVTIDANSSVRKGETIKDTLSTISRYVDLIVVRTPEDIFSDTTLLENIICPVINAGSGETEHPTQAIIDLYTMGENKSVLMVGDLKHSRTAKSLIHLLSKYDNIPYCYSPAALQLPRECADLTQDISKTELDKVLSEVDVVYMVRQQKERWKNNFSHLDWTSFYITKNWLSKMKPDSMILHPLPRGEEIPEFVDKDPRAKYFEQVKNGLSIRQAIIYDLLNK